MLTGLILKSLIGLNCHLEEFVMHKGKQCPINAPPPKPIRMENRKPNRGYGSTKKGMK